MCPDCLAQNVDDGGDKMRSIQTMLIKILGITISSFSWVLILISMSYVSCMGFSFPLQSFLSVHLLEWNTRGVEFDSRISVK